MDPCLQDKFNPVTFYHVPMQSKENEQSGIVLRVSILHFVRYFHWIS